MFADAPQAPLASTETEPEMAVAEGGKATLRCIFHGNPPPKITWRFGMLTVRTSPASTASLVLSLYGSLY